MLIGIEATIGAVMASKGIKIREPACYKWPNLGPHLQMVEK